MEYRNIKEKNLDFFNGLLDRFTDEDHVVGYSRLSHLKRFEKISELGDLRNKSLLDVGCGIGGFCAFLKGKGVSCDYSGIDINPRMIQIAREKHPDIKEQFSVVDILENTVDAQFDYVISNGPLNLKYESTMNMDTTMRLIREMYTIAKIGIAITMTSALARKRNPETFYYQPQEILSEISVFCANVRLDHTYLPHDFALFCYKKNLYDF